MAGEAQSDPSVAEMAVLMNRLGWDAQRLWAVAIGLGDVGSESDVRNHLASGELLSSAQHRVLAAALHDGSFDA